MDIGVDRARYRATLVHWLHPRFSLGVEYNPGEQEFGPLATGVLWTEAPRRPALSVGTSSDRIGTPPWTTSVFLTAAKRSPWLQVPVSGYLSLNWSEHDDGFNLPFGGTLHLGERFAARGMYDGERTHLLLSASHARWTLTALWVWLEHPGIAISTGWGGRTAP